LLYVVNLTKTAESGSASPVIAWIIVLAIIFIVLLVVLIVLMGKKPQKSEEFGESYY
jgi:preprotein translocase subunit SecG